ncbi:MAG: hypothetical protein Q7L55_08665 [Actinomycetota bacterium]|nr:hypothetical protein [Actinomycetota bacterium]
MKVLRKSLTGVAVVGLAVDAYVHLDLAGQYSGVGETVTQGQLFRIEAAMALIAAVLLLVKPGRVTAAFAALVAGGGVLALLLYYFVNVGPIGPLPNMYEPLWYGQKVATLVAQMLATAAALALVVIHSFRPPQPAAERAEHRL